LENCQLIFRKIFKNIFGVYQVLLTRLSNNKETIRMDVIANITTGLITSDARKLFIFNMNA